MEWVHWPQGHVVGRCGDVSWFGVSVVESWAAQWHVPGVPATREAEQEDLVSPGGQGQPGHRSRTPFRKSLKMTN